MHGLGGPRRLVGGCSHIIAWGACADRGTHKVIAQLVWIVVVWIVVWTVMV